MPYGIMLMGCDPSVRSILDSAISTNQLNYKVLGSFANPLDAMGFVTQLDPDIIICSDTLQYLYVDQLIASLSKRMSGLQFIIIEHSENSSIRNLLQLSQVADIIPFKEVSEETFLPALSKASDNIIGHRSCVLSPTAQTYNQEIDDLITQIIDQKKYLEVHYVHLPFLVTGGWVGIIAPISDGTHGSSFSTMRRITELIYEQLAIKAHASPLYTFALTNRSVSFVFGNSTKQFSLIRNYLDNFFSTVNENLYAQGLPKVAVFMSENQVFGNNFHVEYETAAKCAQYSFFACSDRIMTRTSIDAHNKLFDTHQAEAAFSELEKAVLAMDEDQTMACIDRIHDSIRSSLSFAFLRYAKTQFEFIINMQLRHLGRIDETDLLKHNEKSDKSDIFRTCAYYRNLFRLLLRHMRDANHQYANPYINNAVLYICSHLEKSVSLTQVAEAIHISPSYLSHLFVDVTGETFSSMNNAIRIGQAKKLLSMGVSVCKAAEKTGYQSDKYFSRVFKSAVGISPKKYLELHGPKNQGDISNENIQT